MQPKLLFCGFGKNIRIIDGILQNIGHNTGIAVTHCMISFASILPGLPGLEDRLKSDSQSRRVSLSRLPYGEI
jgi:hypothetical protein